MKTNTALDLEIKKIYPLSVVYYAIGAILLIGGIIAAIKLWPEPSLAMTFKYKAIDYIPSLSSFTGGLITCILFSTVGRVLTLFQSQLVVLGHIAVELDRQGMGRAKSWNWSDIEQTRSFAAQPNTTPHHE